MHHISLQSNNQFYLKWECQVFYLCSTILHVAIPRVAMASICHFSHLALADRHYHTEDATTAMSPSDHGLPPSFPQMTKDTKSKDH